MTDRDQAVATLKEARDLLAKKIIRMVNDDSNFAEGLTDEWSESGEVVLELGERMRRLVQVIDNLPLPSYVPSYVPDHVTEETFFDESLGAPYSPLPTLPTWDDFLYAIESARLDNATFILSNLARVEQHVAQNAVIVFAEQWKDEEEFRAKARSLRAQLMSNMNGSLNLIRELFGIGGTMAVGIYHSLKVAV